MIDRFSTILNQTLMPLVKWQITKEFTVKRSPDHPGVWVDGIGGCVGWRAKDITTWGDAPSEQMRISGRFVD